MHNTKNANVKYYVIGVAFVLVILALVLLCARCAKTGSAQTAAANPDGTVITQIAAQDANGKDVSGKLVITSSNQIPDELQNQSSNLLLMDIYWDGNSDPSFPLIITIQDASLTSGNGVSVYHYTNNAWEQVGTYLIENYSVSFSVNSLSPFALMVIDANSSSAPTATAAPAGTANPLATPTATPRPTPTARPSATPTGTSGAKSGTIGAAATMPGGEATLTPATEAPTLTPVTEKPGEVTIAPVTDQPITPTQQPSTGSNTNPTVNPGTGTDSDTGG